MDFLGLFYGERLRNLNGNAFEIFSQFYDLEMAPIHGWLDERFKNATKKNNKLSNLYRTEGNVFYLKKDLCESLKCYTKSLAFATDNSKEYGLALANRSACAYELKDYQSCLNDIELCLRSDYPVELKSKVFVRKADCLSKLNDPPALDRCVKEVVQFFKDTEVANKEKILYKLAEIQGRGAVTPMETEDEYVPPQLPAVNPNLAYASTSVRLNYTEEKGRHILAASNIKRGDVLFVEKAFIFAPIFQEDKSILSLKCYHCLKDTSFCIPCKSCTIAFFCDETCLSTSWVNTHRWECPGMKANIWYELGIALPAFKCFLKGAKSGAIFMHDNYQPGEDLENYGDPLNNYKYFNRLVSNMDRAPQLAPFVITAGICCIYLEKYTDFFEWLLSQKSTQRRHRSELKKYVGGLITKHLAQLVCNSHIIEHWPNCSEDTLFPEIPQIIAAGVFPSVSLMNHSCRPNITNFFVCDTIIVLALDDIPEGEEVYNCYGIDYRYMERDMRQLKCMEQYYFECNCNICSDRTRELGNLDYYVCPKCNGEIYETKRSKSQCERCRRSFKLSQFRKLNSKADALMAESSVLESLDIRQKCLSKYHKDFDEVYYQTYLKFIEEGDLDRSLKYFILWLEHQKARQGNHSRDVGTKLFIAAFSVVHLLQLKIHQANVHFSAHLQQVEMMFREAKQILRLYYPQSVTDKVYKKIQVISLPPPL